MHTPQSINTRSNHTQAILQWIATQQDTLKTPLYLYSATALRHAVTAYQALFPKHSHGFYALKANPQAALVKQMAMLGIGAEITGRGEWQSADLAGIATINRLAGGVCKSHAYLTMLCKQGNAAIVIESESEWQQLQIVSQQLQSAEFAPPNFLLRINPNVSFGGLNMAGGSQFGLSVTQAVAIAQQASQQPTVRFQGLHFYFGSQRLEIDPIIAAIETVEQIVQTFQQAGVTITIVDLGLGLGVPYLARDKALALETLQTQLHAHWQRPVWENITLWFEAGRALVATSGYYIARVIERKQLHGKTFIFLDGGLNVHNPGVGLGRFFRRNPRFHFVCATPTDEMETVNIVGNLCTTADTLGNDVVVPRLAVGDLVIVPNAGAYCQTTALWGFNTQPLFQEAILTPDNTLTYIPAQHTQLR
ncbi:MAG TPA: hypothetical protein ENJ56_00180 [Anaerolineae bacterium]|nr:hypothetical protein [Anaerolineae bacterium]